MHHICNCFSSCCSWRKKLLYRNPNKGKRTSVTLRPTKFEGLITWKTESKISYLNTYLCISHQAKQCGASDNVINTKVTEKKFFFFEIHQIKKNTD